MSGSYWSANQVTFVVKWQGIFSIQSAGRNSPTSPSTCLTSPLVTADAPSVFCPFQILRSVTDEQHVRSHAQKELAGEITSVDRL